MNRWPRWIIGLLALPLGASAAAPLEFGNAIFSRNSDAPSAAVIGDWNEDGLPDYAVTNQFDNSVSIAFGRGDGAFLETAGKVEVGAFPDQIVVADWDGDGREDLAATNADEPTLTILVGEAGGGFRASAEVEIGRGLRDLAVVDWNNDGLPDLAVVSETGAGGSLALLENRRGRFAVAHRLALDGLPAAIEAADFDCDGRADIAIALKGPDRLEIRLGRHGLRRQEPSVALAAAPAALGIGDLDGDGASEVVVAFPARKSLQILRYNARDGLRSGGSFTLAGAPVDLVLADFDGDGQLDAAVALAAVDRVQLLRGVVAIGFVDGGMLSTGLRPTDVIVGDFNRDERLDLLVVNHGGKSLSAFLNTTARPSAGRRSAPNPSRRERCGGGIL